VNDVCLLSYVSAERQFIGVTFRLTEDHRTSLAAAVDLQHGTDGNGTAMVATSNCKVLQCIKTRIQFQPTQLSTNYAGYYN